MINAFFIVVSQGTRLHAWTVKYFVTFQFAIIVSHLFSEVVDIFIEACMDGKAMFEYETQVKHLLDTAIGVYQFTTTTLYSLLFAWTA